MIKYLLLFLLIIPFCYASDLSDYPDFFYDKDFNLQLVISRTESSDHNIAATNMIFSLPERKGIKNVFDDEVKDYSTDFILVGNPCQNKVTKKFFGEDCTLGLKKGEGLIQYLNKDGSDIILIAALDDEDLVKVSEEVRKNSKILKENKVIIGKKVVEEKKSMCTIDDKSLEEGEVSSLNGKPVYCSSEGIKDQKNQGEECNNNYECFNNKCINGKCGEEKFFVRIWNWIKNLF